MKSNPGELYLIRGIADRDVVEWPVGGLLMGYLCHAKSAMTMILISHNTKRDIAPTREHV
jgi:hypothetical protein